MPSPDPRDESAARSQPPSPRGPSWSELEAAGLLPKKSVDPSLTEDGWPTEDVIPDPTPSGIARMIPPPPPPAPAESLRPVGPAALPPATVPLVPPVSKPLSAPDRTSTPTAVTAVTAYPTAPVVETAPPSMQAVVTGSVPVTPVASAARSVRLPSELVAGPRLSGVLEGRRRFFRRRPRVRKVSRVVRRVDAWTVFKISLVLYAVLYAVLLIAGSLLWKLALSTGTVDNIQGFIKELFGLKTFVINGEKLFHASRTLGLILIIFGTGFHVTLAVLFNLISDLVGGVRVTVLEEEVVLRERDRNQGGSQSD